MSIQIIAVTENNLADLRNISIQTFTETYADKNTEEDLALYIKNSFALDKLNAEVGNKGSSFFLAVEKDIAIGYLKINRGDAQTDLQDTDSLEIERIYVAQSHQSQGIGRLLYKKAIQVAKDLSLSYIWLGVWEHNPKAIQFYESNGFVAFDKHVFILGDDEQTDILMKVLLNNIAYL